MFVHDKGIKPVVICVDTVLVCMSMIIIHAVVDLFFIFFLNSRIQEILYYTSLAGRSGHPDIYGHVIWFERK